MSKRATRISFRISLLLAGLAIASASSPRAADYPDHSVKVIVPFPPGGSTDVVGRIVMQKLSERFGQQFFIENIAGASGNIGVAAAARAPHDGYTILRLGEYGGEPEFVQIASIRRRKGFHPGHQNRRLTECLAGQLRVSSQDDDGVDRLNEG